MTRESWTDERLDDLSKGVDRRFDEVDRRFDEVDRRFGEVDRRFDEVDRRFDQVDRRLEKLTERFDSLQQTMILVGGGLIGTLVIGIINLIATHA